MRALILLIYTGFRENSTRPAIPRRIPPLGKESHAKHEKVGLEFDRSNCRVAKSTVIRGREREEGHEHEGDQVDPEEGLVDSPHGTT